MLGHAFVAAGPRVWISSAADVRLLGVVELSAARRGNEIHAGAREGGPEIRGFFDAASAVNGFLGQISTAHCVVGADALTHGSEHVQWSFHPVLARAAVAIRAGISARKKRGHRVGMRV